MSSSASQESCRQESHRGDEDDLCLELLTPSNVFANVGIATTSDGSEQNGDLTQCEETSRKSKEPILTAVNQSVVVLLEGLCAVSTALEVHGSDSLRAALGIVVQSDVLEGTNC